MKYPRHIKYRDSGIEWLGEVPEGWTVASCRSFLEEKTAKNENGESDFYLSLVAQRGVLPYEEKGDIGNKKPEDLAKCKMVSVGDFVINSMNFGIGAFGISQYFGVCSPVYIVMSILDGMDMKYLSRIFENANFQMYAQSFGNGILSHRAAISWSIIKNLKLPSPPKEEQRVIAAFLDRETGRIDSLIAEQEKLIVLLKEKRQAVISHAVTKGLHPDAPMKDSGVEWLGMVPKGWEILQLKHMASILRGRFTHRPRNDPAFYDGDYPFIQTGDITGVERHIVGYRQTLNELGKSVSKEFPKDTLVMAIAANIGDVAILTFPAYFPDSIVGFSPHESVQLGYLYYYMIALKPQLLKYSTISTQMNINTDQIGSMIALRPPIHEQFDIITYLDKVTNDISKLIGEAEQMVALLRERRAALISAAVTGKIDVRDLVPTETG